LVSIRVLHTKEDVWELDDQGGHCCVSKATKTIYEFKEAL